MATLRELKGRIGSVASSEKITGAMKMISSAKMHKAELALRKLMPFRRQIQTIIGSLVTADTEFHSPLTEVREVNSVALLVFGSDDGLCGAYNVNIFKEFLHHVAEYRADFGDDVKIHVYAIGGKVRKAISKIADGNIVLETMEGVDSKTTGEGVRVFMDHMRDCFIRGVYDRVDALYMRFFSVSRQRPALDTLLPVSQEAFFEEGIKPQCRPYLFEPDAATIFTSVLPMYLLSVMQDIFTENRASEQASRVMAMQSANDNAQKLLEQLRLEYNKLRQQSITTELLDILGGQIR